jgi:hypothetical protein
MKCPSFVRKATLLAAALAATTAGFGMEVVNVEKGSLNLDGRLQFFGHGQIVKDPYRNDGRLFLFLKQARLHFFGNVEDTKYDVQLAFAGEDEVKTGQNASLNLLDFSFDVPLIWGTTLKVGQFKVPYSRERLLNGGQQLFADRSIDNVAFRVGRDVGGAVYAKGDKFAGTVGVFTGGGRDVPERYLPEKLGFPMVVFRGGYDDGVDKNLFDLDQSVGEVNRVVKAAYVNSLWMHDTAIGHNVVLGLKTAEIPLLLNKNWNPYLGKAPLDRGNIFQTGGDLVLKAPLGGYTVAAEAEGNYAMFENKYGRIEISGVRGHLGASKGNLEVAARYAYLLLDTDMTPGGGKKIMTGRSPIQEITPAITYHIKKGRSKVILDLPILVNAPVAVEKGLGTYVLIPEQPDQTTVATTAGNIITRRTIVEGRMIYQLMF